MYKEGKLKMAKLSEDLFLYVKASIIFTLKLKGYTFKGSNCYCAIFILASLVNGSLLLRRELARWSKIPFWTGLINRGRKQDLQQHLSEGQDSSPDSCPSHKKL